MTDQAPNVIVGAANPFGFVERRALVAYLVAHFDESGKFHDKDITTFAGFMADPYAWEHFNAAWSSLLRYFGMPVFKSAKAFRFASPLGSKVAATGVDARIEALHKFVAVIQEHIGFGTSWAIDARAFRGLEESRKAKLRDPHHAAFRFVLGTLKDELSGDDRISLICDDEQKYSVECYKIYTGIRSEDHGIRRGFISIGFGDDYHFPQLQAADLFAGLSRLEAEREFLGRQHPIQPVFDGILAPSPRSLLRATGYFCGESKLRELSA